MRRVSPLYTADIYYSYFDKHHNSLTIPYEDGSAQTFELLKRYDDHQTGFVAASFINRKDGHAVLLYKGMDRPFSDQGDGRFGFLKDVWTIAQSHLHGTSRQQEQAEEAYFDTLRDPAVKDIEIAGFSMGTIFTNYMAAKHNAKGTVSADLGIADSTLKRLFNERSQGKPVDAAGANSLVSIAQQMRDNIVVLNLDADLLPKIFALGPSRGREIDLDGGPEPVPEGIEHDMGVYMSRAGKIDAARNRQPQSAVPLASLPLPAFS